MTISGECFCGAISYEVAAALCGAVVGKVHGITLGCVNSDPLIEIGYHLYAGPKARWELIPDGVKIDHGAAPAF